MTTIESAKELIAELCRGLYAQGHVSGTGGGVSVRVGDAIVMAPSGVQKERMEPGDMFVLNADGSLREPPTNGARALSAPRPGPSPGAPAVPARRPRAPKLSECAPIFQVAYDLRGAGAVIHSHSMNAVLATLLDESSDVLRVTHEEMIKGVVGHGYFSVLEIPIVENTAREAELTDRVRQAMLRYPKAQAVLVRRHGVYVWGEDWVQAKTQSECYEYLFEYAVKLRQMGIDAALPPPPKSLEDRKAREAFEAKEREAFEAKEREANGETDGKDGASTPLANGNGDVAAPLANGNGDVAAPLANGNGDVAAPLANGNGDVAAPLANGNGDVAAPLANGNGDVAAPLAKRPRRLPRSPLPAAVVLDIEGTLLPISFVAETLFPYASEERVRAHLEATYDSEQTQADIQLLRDQATQDAADGVDNSPAVAPASDGREAVIDSAIAAVRAAMASDRKLRGLKSIQGRVWEQGYRSGELRAELFRDVPDALVAWRDAGVKSYIYSSGSRQAQRLLFANTTAGDLRPYLFGFFDTTVGPKVMSSSYKDIAESIGVDDPAQLLFATDALKEAVAAKEAGWKTVLLDRPGNAPLPEGHGFPLVKTVDGLLDLYRELA